MQKQLAKNMIRSLGLMALVLMSHADLMEECRSKQSPLPHEKGTCGGDTTSMLQNKMTLDEAKLTYDTEDYLLKDAYIKDLLNGDWQERLVATQKMEKSMQNDVEKMVTNGGGPPVSDKLLAVVKKEMEALRKSLVEEHESLQKQMNDASALAEKCNKNMNTTKGGSVAKAQKGMNERKTTHHTCREAELSAYKEKNKSCIVMLSNSGTACKAAPSCSCESEKCDDAGSVLSCLQKQRQWVESYKNKLKAQKIDCDKRTSTWSKKADACDTDQSNYEIAVCMYAKQLDVMCSTLKTCYSDAIATYGSTKKLVKVQEKDMKAMMASAKMIVCYFGVLKKGSKGKVSMKDYDVCKNLNVNSDRVYLKNTVKDLAIKYKPAVAQETCDVMSNTPGDDKWAATEYSRYTQDWMRETAVCLHKTTKGLD